MKELIKFSSASHWYDRDGNPRHDADLRGARKEMLRPSPTSIDKDEFKNDFLERWKMQQLVSACISQPRNSVESDEEYANRLYNLSNSKSRTSSEFGNRIHDAIEDYPNLPEEELMPWFHSFSSFYSQFISRKISSEEVLVDNEIAVAGRCDFIGEGLGVMSGEIIADWKTQDVKTDKKGRKDPVFYDSWGRQLSFYAVTHAKRNGTFPSLPNCLSVIIDSNHEAGIYHKLWTKDEIVSSYEDFTIAAFRWFKRKKYWPVGKWSVVPSIPMPINL